MKQSIKRRLKVYLPIIIAVVLISAIVLVFLLLNRVTAKDYFNALSKSNYTKQTQSTTIKDGGTLIYEKTELIIFDKDNVYHKIHERQLSDDLNVDYEETTTEFYYSQDTMYYFEEGVWKSKAFKISKNLLRYVLKTDYFATLNFQKKFENEGVLNGTIKSKNTKNVVDIDSLNNMSVSMTVSNQFQVKSFEINAKTATNRDVKILNEYSYNQEVVNMPC